MQSLQDRSVADAARIVRSKCARTRYAAQLDLLARARTATLTAALTRMLEQTQLVFVSIQKANGTGSRRQLLRGTIGYAPHVAFWVGISSPHLRARNGNGPFRFVSPLYPVTSTSSEDAQ